LCRVNKIRNSQHGSFPEYFFRVQTVIRQAISLYSGVGGLDFGFEAAGFRTALSVEMDPVACRTLRLNRRWPVLQGDIHSFTSREILRKAGLRSGEADILIGGPPCQPFSKSSYWVRGDAARLEDPRANTLTAFLRVLRDTKPKTFLLENVPGLAFKGKDEGLRHVLDALREINRQAKTNYIATWSVINAATLGVPQQRERLFVVASRDGRPFEFPKATHAAAEKCDLIRGQEPFRTAWDALGDLPERLDDEELAPSGFWADLLPTIPEGSNYLFHTNRGGGASIFGWRSRYWSLLLKLAKRLPSWTIQAQPGPAIGPFHWTSRKLSAAELCRLQTFPEGIRFDCSRNEIQRLVGNAVPSLVAEVVGRAIREQFFDERRGTRGLRLLLPSRGVAPPPVVRKPIPRKYKVLIGEHPDHPGEGLGVGARRRMAFSKKSGRSKMLMVAAKG
jgi:DNA (cytosine-5)-methyltransferase 1